ncbi:hypothetical protein BDF19DRAFT_451175 [Syncephalis fuscata]|nr:hypothetical protein BDF19DRAFT_451175 [Syncephalis fuscata]
MKGLHIAFVAIAALLLVLYAVTLNLLWRYRYISPLQHRRRHLVVVTSGGLLTLLACTSHWLLTNWYLLAPIFTESPSPSATTINCNSWLWILALAWPLWTLAVLSRAIYYWLAWEGQCGVVKEAEWRRRAHATHHVAQSSDTVPSASAIPSPDNTLLSKSIYSSISTTIEATWNTTRLTEGQKNLATISASSINQTGNSSDEDSSSNGHEFLNVSLADNKITGGNQASTAYGVTETPSNYSVNLDLESQKVHAHRMQSIHKWLQLGRLPIVAITVSILLMLGLAWPLQSTLKYPGNDGIPVDCMIGLGWKTLPIYAVTLLLWIVGGPWVYYLLRRLPTGLLTFTPAEWLCSIIIVCLQLIIAITITVIANQRSVTYFDSQPLILIHTACHVIGLLLVFLFLILRPVLLLSATANTSSTQYLPTTPCSQMPSVAPRINFSSKPVKRPSFSSAGSTIQLESSTHLAVTPEDEVGNTSKTTTSSGNSRSQTRTNTSGQRPRRSTHATIYSIASALSFTSQSTATTIATMAPPTSYQRFLSMLDDRRQLALFREFAVKNYCVEHVLFYEHCHRLYRLLASPDGVDAQLLMEETREIVYLFLQPNATYEINLSSRVRESLRQASQAKEEVARLLYQHTYPRFLRWRKEEMDETDDADREPFTLANNRSNQQQVIVPLPSPSRLQQPLSLLLPVVTVEKVDN